MKQISVGEFLIRCLAGEGVEMMCGIIDGAHIPIVVHTPAYGIRYVNARHEEAAVHIAEGYARIARKPGVVIGNPACGTGNMLAGLVSAHGEGHPVIAIGTTRSRIRTDPNRGGAWQAADTEAMARPIAKYAATIRQWERVPEMLRAAFRAALTGRPGPTIDQVRKTDTTAVTTPASFPGAVPRSGSGGPQFHGRGHLAAEARDCMGRTTASV